MPAIDKLESELQENPPRTVAELQDILGMTGYDMVPSESDAEDMIEGDMEMLGADEEADESMAVADEMEVEEDMGPMDMGMMDSPPPMPMNSRGDRMKEIRAAAKKALGG
mgnify:FL=1